MTRLIITNKNALPKSCTELRRQILSANPKIAFDASPLKKRDGFQVKVSPDQVSLMSDILTSLNLHFFVVTPKKVLALRNVQSSFTEQELFEFLQCEITGVERIHIIKPKDANSSRMSVKIFVNLQAWEQANNILVSRMQSNQKKFVKIYHPTQFSPMYLYEWVDYSKQKPEPANQPRASTSVIIPTSSTSNDSTNVSYAKIASKKSPVPTTTQKLSSPVKMDIDQESPATHKQQMQPSPLTAALNSLMIQTDSLTHQISALTKANEIHTQSIQKCVESQTFLGSQMSTILSNQQNIIDQINLLTATVSSLTSPIPNLTNQFSPTIPTTLPFQQTLPFNMASPQQPLNPPPHLLQFPMNMTSFANSPTNTATYVPPQKLNQRINHSSLPSVSSSPIPSPSKSILKEKTPLKAEHQNQKVNPTEESNLTQSTVNQMDILLSPKNQNSSKRVVSPHPDTIQPPPKKTKNER